MAYNCHKVNQEPHLPPLFFLLLLLLLHFHPHPPHLHLRHPHTHHFFPLLFTPPPPHKDELTFLSLRNPSGTSSSGCNLTNEPHHRPYPD